MNTPKPYELYHLDEEAIEAVIVLTPEGAREMNKQLEFRGERVRWQPMVWDEEDAAYFEAVYHTQY